uniref:NADH:ubiquinone reductase (H(+)-translocating) n=1 Tax=Cleptes metallicorpus TaxID=2491147 RepID=A0A3S8V0E2_9HYME|nr:NADH dehydrogenase subunit 5 [Cleptes metallicorpus]
MFMFILFYLFIFLSFIMFMLSLFFMVNKISLFIEWDLISLNSLFMEVLLVVDFFSLLFISVVLLISSMILIYSFYYLLGDLNIYRFFLLIFLFVMSMIFMIISPNFMSILLGWDGLGLISYCLIIYYHSFKSFNSGMITVLINRLGDIGILVLISMYLYFGSWNLMLYKVNLDLMVMFLLLVCFTKSAQFPFSSWLPLAMAAPTPVSSLVHSSTLVTAGVYLMIRYNFNLVESSLKIYFLWTCSLTMLMSGLNACYEFDLKKIIALSTLSQLSFMFIILFFGSSILCFYHLLMHAMFKSLLFLCSGVIIHNSKNNQDIRLLGFMMSDMYIITFCFVMCKISLCGLFFLSGFYSKDLILEFIFMSKLNLFYLFILLISCFLTMVYSLRLIIYLFFKYNKFYCVNMVSFNMNMKLSMLILLIMSIYGGAVSSWIFFDQEVLIILPLYIKMIMIIFLLLMIIMYNFFDKFNYTFFLKWMFYTMWFLDLLISFSYLYIYLADKYMMMNLDKGWIEFYSGIGVNSLIKFIFFKYEIKYLFFFMFIIFIFLICLIGLLLNLIF